MRHPHQSPGLLLFNTIELMESQEFVRNYPNYIQMGGGMNSAKVPWAYQHPIQTDFLFDLPHTIEKITSTLDLLMKERQLDLSNSGAPVARWRVPFRENLNIDLS
jgi:hypothetical protein